MRGAAGNGASFQWRPVADGASSNSDSTTVVKPPYWVKIDRLGDNLSGSYSADGKTWRPLGVPQTIAMTAPVYIGLCVTSHAAGEQRSFEFDSITTTGGVTGSWQGAVIDSPRYNSKANLYVTVEDSAGKSATASDPALANAADWTQWTIPFSSLAGVNLSKVKKLTVGVGDRASPKAGGAGTLYIDDIGFGKPIQWVALPGEVVVEAESATSITAPMAISGDSLASGGKYIGTPTTQADSSSNPPATGIAQIPFTVAGGKYKLLFRVLIPGDNNSVWVRIADGTTQTSNHASGWVRFNDIAAGETWHWDEVHSSDDGNQVVEWTLAAGAHTLEIAYREAGAQVDVIVIQPLN